jgi:capsular exopolysaccharide synthesis family protein
MRRALVAIFRYKWLVLAIVLLGLTSGVVVTRRFRPAFEVQSTIWISTEGNTWPDGPMRGGRLLPSNSWPDLLRSFAVLDTVTRGLRLFVYPANREDLPLFADLTTSSPSRTGSYILQIDDANNRYSLERANGQVVETGIVGDTIGRNLGFRWAPTANKLRGRRNLRFSLSSPRDASIALRSRLRAELPEDGNLLRVALTGDDPYVVARTLNEISHQFVAAAADLKRRSLVEFSRTLDRQVQFAESELRDAELAYRDFRVKTITLPTESATPGGAAQPRDPFVATFFQQKVAYEALVQQHQTLERMLAEIEHGNGSVDALWSVLSTDNEWQELRNALTEYSQKEAALRAAQQVYTDEHRTVQDLKSGLARLRAKTIPAMATAMLDQLGRREQELGARLNANSKQLQEIPARTLEEMRLRRSVEVRSAVYSTLRNRFEEARVAEAGAVPDVSILDSAVTPLFPSQNRGPQLLISTLLGSIALGAFVAIVLDRMDRRFRYPEQVPSVLRLPIIGAVPNTKARRRGGQDPIRVAQLVEAFRSLRLSSLYSLPRDSTPILSVTSPGPGDGKSLVSSNLALAFAQAGYRTVIVDGDVRRGELHSTFGVTRRPGLVDVLSDNASLSDALKQTTYDNLTVLPAGSRLQRAPELLSGPALPRLLPELRRQFDAIIVDSCPLGAGIDPFALAAVTGNIIIVVRAGKTDLRLARAKLEALARFPTNVLGVVVNDVKVAGDYREYSYLPQYGEEADITPAQVIARAVR